ncbi:MAG: hypothetical protein JRN26_00925 [Nitrososphaerota archaeon]|jgi:uncharacterized membrane protein|nr:hypothetical protein [Nitrososphaerota archaeon]MDG6928236.1 hypothetical protein [Nitrososphaerota archaeon]MDG6930730.1 hypothetical protein [Nitrososphaerota archaeon]MDG6931834.1 hypothetical protein [Nitrososphaerota archaeon]MDG6935442.1 hypothetical protein [Nitrososphaerota archaeon]
MNAKNPLMLGIILVMAGIVLTFVYPMSNSYDIGQVISGISTTCSLTGIGSIIVAIYIHYGRK